MLAAWPAHVEDEFINTPPKHHLLEHLGEDIISIPVREEIIESYQELKRIDISFEKRRIKAINISIKGSGRRSRLIEGIEDLKTIIICS